VKYGDHRAVWRGWYAPAAVVALALALVVGYFPVALALVVGLYFTWMFFAELISGWLLPLGWFFAFVLASRLTL